MSGREPSEGSEEIRRRNFLLNVLEGAVFIASAGFASMQTVLPALISRLGGTSVAVGAISVVVHVGVFLPQIFAARYVSTHQWKKPWTIRYGFLHRLAYLPLGVIVWMFGQSNPAVALGLFFLFFGAAQVLAGVATPAWVDLYAKLTPVRRRGRLAGFRNSLGGAFAFACGIVLTWYLSHFSFPANFALALLSASALQFGSLLIQSTLEESTPSPVAASAPMRTFLDGLPAVLRSNPEYRRFLAACAFMIPAAMPLWFFTVYALETYEGGVELVGRYTVTMVAAQVIAAPLTGIVNDRYGNRAGLIIAAGATLLATVTALLAPSASWFLLVYVFVGVNIASEIMTRYNMAVEYGPVPQRSTYIALTNTVLAPLYLSALLGGVIVGQLGYTALFVVSLWCSVSALLLIVFRIRDPRAHIVQGAS